MDTMGMGQGSMTMTSKLTTAKAYAVLRVEDYQRAKQFYQEKLGLEVRDDFEGPMGNGMVMMGDSGFEIYERPGMPAPQNTTLGFMVSDFDGVMDDLRRRGVVFEEYDIPEMNLKTINGVAMMDSTRVAWFKDTESNILSITDMTGMQAKGGMM
jgi:predicted enzyme related to lactoylglutathione lyase